MSGKTVIRGGLLFFCAFFFLPLVYFYSSAFSEEGLSGAASSFVSILLNDAPGVLAFTAGQAALSALFSVVLALPGAWMISHFSFPGKRFFHSLSLIPFILPSIIVIICMISFYGKSGLINQLFGTDFNLIYNLSGILLAHVFYNFSLAIRVIGEGWQRIDQRYGEAARSLGDSPVRTLFRVTLPLLSPSLITAFLLVFIYCFLSFGIILVFGGVRFTTFEVMIYQEMYVKLDLVRASAYSLIQLAFSAAFIALAGKHIARGQTVQPGGIRFSVRPLSREASWKRILLYTYGALVLLFLFGPLVTMTLRSFFENGAFTLDSYRALFQPEFSRRNIEGIIRSTIPGVIFTSIGVAVLSGTITFFTALASAFALKGRRSRLADVVFQSPFGLSMVTLGLGLRLLYGDVLPFLPLVVIGQFFITFPFVFRVLRTTVEGLRPSYIESAKSLGASKLGVYTHVAFPILKRGLLNAYAYSLAIPFADLTMVLSVSRGSLATFPVAIYRLIGFRSFDLALALGVIYILICLLLFYWIDTTSFRNSPGSGDSGRDLT